MTRRLAAELAATAAVCALVGLCHLAADWRRPWIGPCDCGRRWT